MPRRRGKTLLLGAASFLLLLLGVTTVNAQVCPFDPNGTLLADPWCHGNIGAGTGSASYASGVFTVTGQCTGNCIWNNADEFHYVYRQYTGDFVFIARLSTFVNNDPNNPSYSVAGLMLRESVAPGSRQVFIERGPQVAPSIAFTLWRPTTAEVSFEGGKVSDTTIPYYLKIVRLKDEISTYVSSDSVTWNWGDGITLTNLPSTVIVGMAVARYSNPDPATFDSVSVNPLSLPYHTSWFGNSLPGGTTLIQQDISAIYLDPNSGKIFTNTPYEESGTEAGIYDINGSMIGKLDDTHNNKYGGYAITSDGTYVYMTMYDFTYGYCVRRYLVNGRTAGFGGAGADASLLQLNTNGPPRGLAINRSNNELYVSDSDANSIRVYDANSMAPIRSFGVARPRGMAIDLNGKLWIIQASDGSDNAKVLRYDPIDPNVPPLVIMGVTTFTPTSVTVDSTGTVWVTDDGIDQQVKKYTSSGGSAGFFGNQLGIYAGTRGQVQSKKLNGPVGIGVDDANNIYVVSDGVDTGLGGTAGSAGQGTGTEMRKFNSSENLQWEKYGLEFVDTADADPDPNSNGRDLFTKDAHYTMDYSKPSGQQWTYTGLTLDRFTYPDDMRLHRNETNGVGHTAGVFIRRMEITPGIKKRFMFLTTQLGSHLGVYRFEDNSEIAVPCGMLVSSHPNSPWPPYQPTDPSRRWIWHDDNGNGMMDPNSTEFEDDGPNMSIYGWYVDDDGDIWIANEYDSATLPAIRRYRHSIDSHGCPAYHASSVNDYTRPSPFGTWSDSNTGIERAYYIPPPADTMYLAGYTPTDRKVGAEIGMLGTTLARYNDWTTTRTFQWSIPLPYSATPPVNNIFDIAKSMDVAGGRVFVVMQHTSEVIEYDTASGAELKRMRPGPEVGGKSGYIDNVVGLNAFQRANGEYIVLVEEDLLAKGLLYRELSLPLYQLDTFDANTFSGGSGTGGTYTQVTFNSNSAAKFEDTPHTNGNSGNNNSVSVFTRSLTTSNPLVIRINQIYNQPVGTTPVSFDFSFKVERTAPGSLPIAAGITAGIQFNNYDGVNIPQFPTGSPEPSIFSTPAYTHDESSNEVLELVDRNAISTYRFTVVPNGGLRNITGLDFRFRVQVNRSGGTESYAIDDLIVNEVLP